MNCIEAKLYPYKSTVVNVNDIVNDSCGDKRIIPYLIKLQLKEEGLPVNINILDIENQIFEKELCFSKIIDDVYMIEWID